ncbi:Ras guanine nucleotide exchange factor [Globisporangium polare]
MVAKDPAAASSSSAAAPSSSSTTGRATGGSTSRSTAGAGSSSSQRSHRQPYPGSSSSSISSVSSSSTATTNRTVYSEHLLELNVDTRHPSRLNTSSSTISSATSSTSRARRQTDGDSVSTIREDAVVATPDVGPEKFAAKVGARENYENSSSSSGPGSDKDSPQQTSKSGTNSSSTASNHSATSSKPSRMIVKRRTLGNSRATSVTSTSIPNKYVRQTSKEEVPPPPAASQSGSGQSSAAGEYTINSRAGVESAQGHPGFFPEHGQEQREERARSGSHGHRRTDASSTTSSQHPSQPQSTTPRTQARKMLRQEDPDETKEGGGDPKARPVRIKYETPTRGIGGGKREISHASLGKLIARLTDAHQYDTQFRDVFLLTFRCFCSPYDFIKKLMKRYTAVLTMCGGLDPETLHETQMVLDQIAEEEENDRSSTSTSISTAKSDINTGMEANVSIMRLLSVLKFWIKESGFIEMDLQGDRRSQKKLMAFLSEIQSTSPVASIRKHAETMLLMVAQLVRMQSQPQPSPYQPPQHHTAPVVLFHPSTSASSSSGIPPPLPLVASTSVSSITTDSISGDKPRLVDERSTEIPQARDRMLTAAMSKLKLTRSSSDPKRERSMVKLKLKQGGNGDIFQLRSRGTADDMHQAKMASSSGAPKIMRGVTTGSTENDVHRLEDSIKDSMMYRSRITVPRNSSRTSYDNVEPLSGITAQELADQLTLVEAEHYFAKVNPRELTNKAWTRETKFKEAPHVMTLIELFDATAEWVSSEILHPRLQAAERAKILTLFIDAAENCYQMNNFNTLFEIFTGLSAPCVRQLNTTWGLVGATATEKYQFLHGICSTEDNYRNYRQQFGFAEGQPRLPCWFILVKDLFQYEESMKSTEDGLVNWQKYRKIYRVISDALDRQNVSYLPASGATSTSTSSAISRKGKGVLRHNQKVQNLIRHRLETIRKDSTVLYQLARNANTQESILFVNSLSEAGFL